MLKAKGWINSKGRKIDKDWIMTTERIDNAHIELYNKSQQGKIYDKKGYEKLSLEALTIFNKFYNIAFIGGGGKCIELEYDELVQA